MRQHLAKLTASVLTLSLLTLASCASAPDPIQVETQPLERAQLIVPDPTPLNLRKVEWIVLTPNNMEKFFQENPEITVLFAISAEGYQNTALNLAEIRVLVEEQKNIIAAYKDYYGPEETIE